MKHRGSATTVKVLDKRDWLFRSAVALRAEIAMLCWEQRVAYEMDMYEANCMGGWYPPIGSLDDERGRWNERQQEDLDAEWHFERGWETHEKAEQEEEVAAVQNARAGS